MVDENRIEGTARNMGGKIKDAVGGLTGDAGTQASGKADQAAGTAQDTFGATLDQAGAWRDKLEAFTKDRPLLALLAAVSVGYVLHMTTRPGRR